MSQLFKNKGSLLGLEVLAQTHSILLPFPILSISIVFFSEVISYKILIIQIWWKILLKICKCMMLAVEPHNNIFPYHRINGVQ